MKKIGRTIALLLVLVMLASSFTSCTGLVLSLGWGYSVPVWLGMTAVGLDLLALLALYIWFNVEAPNDTGIYMAGAGNYNPDNYYSAMEIINSLPLAERLAFMEKINSLPEEKQASLFRDVNSLPETEITASMERLNALSEEELSSAVSEFNSLNEAEMNTLVERLNQKAMALPRSVAFAY